MESKRKNMFIIIADFVLLFFILVLVVLIVNKKTHFIRKLKTKLSVQKTVKHTPQNIFYISPLSAQKIDSHKDYQLRSKLILLKHNLYFNTKKGKFFKYDIKKKNITANEQNFIYVSALYLFQNNFIFKDTTNHFFQLSFQNLHITPLFYYPTGEKITDFPNIYKINSDQVDDFIFPNSYSHIVALNGKSFTAIWTFEDTTASVQYSPIGLYANADSILDFTFIDDNGVLYLIDGKSGWLLWKYPLQERTTSQLYVEDINHDGKKEIIGFTTANKLFIFDYKGNKLTDTELSDITNPTFLFYDFNKNHIKEICILTKNKIMIFNGISKTALWEKSFDSSLLTQTISLIDVNKDKIKDVLIACEDGFLYAFDGLTGKMIFKFELEFYPLTNFVFEKDTFYYISDDNYIIKLKITKNK